MWKKRCRTLVFVEEFLEEEPLGYEQYFHKDFCSCFHTNEKLLVKWNTPNSKLQCLRVLLKSFRHSAETSEKACYCSFSVKSRFSFSPRATTIFGCCFKTRGNVKTACRHFFGWFRVLCSLEQNGWNTFHVSQNRNIASQSPNGFSRLFRLFLFRNRVNRTHPKIDR